MNYPWLDYGWDFGLGPPAWRGSRQAPRWFEHVDEHLERLRDLGISVVRWFVLADGLTYGSQRDAPRLEGPTAAHWRFEPPALDQEAIDHFDELLRRFEGTATGGMPPIQLIPVLIDFHFCKPGIQPVEEVDPANPLRTRPDPAWVKQGRADAIRDPAKRARFLAGALDPLLSVSAGHRDAIYAWELINEPDWITQGWHPRAVSSPPIPERAMLDFLAEGKQRIRAAGFKPTIGFASLRTLQRAGVSAEINQFHYYPAGRARLERHEFDARFPGIVGEFATSTGDVWPDLARDCQGITHRLTLLAERGYPLAIPWAFLSQDRHTAWSAAVEREVQAFTQGA